jgi:hypothetical protein
VAPSPVGAWGAEAAEDVGIVERQKALLLEGLVAVNIFVHSPVPDEPACIATADLSTSLFQVAVPLPPRATQLDNETVTTE